MDQQMLQCMITQDTVEFSQFSSYDDDVKDAVRTWVQEQPKTCSPKELKIQLNDTGIASTCREIEEKGDITITSMFIY